MRKKNILIQDLQRGVKNKRPEKKAGVHDITTMSTSAHLHTI